MIRDLHLGFKLDFDSAEEQEDSEDILMWLLGINCRLNRMYLRKHPEVPALYDSDIVYAPPDQADGRRPLTRGELRKLVRIMREMAFDPETALMVIRMRKGIEIFLDIPALLRRGMGDCNELVPLRVAELWRANIAASPYLVKHRNDRGGWTYHAVVLWPDGSSEDPSRILGMGGPEAAEERKEEIRKNKERWNTHLAEAQHLIQVEGALPETVGKRIDAMGLVPKSLVFRSPYERAA